MKNAAHDAAILRTQVHIILMAYTANLVASGADADYIADILAVFILNLLKNESDAFTTLNHAATHLLANISETEVAHAA